MEPLQRSRKILATKISYISQIMIYFGYIHECAELYRQLCRDSREEWNSKSYAIFKVIMKNKDSRYKMLIKKSFTKKNADFLLKSGVYNYFSLGVLVDNQQSIEAIIKFIEGLGDYASFLFYELQLLVYNSTFNEANKLLKLYVDKDFDPEALKVKFYGKSQNQHSLEFYSNLNKLPYSTLSNPLYLTPVNL